MSSSHVQFVKNHDLHQLQLLCTPGNGYHSHGLGFTLISLVLDFTGLFLGHQYLVVVDALSKWIDVHMMNSITSSKTIEKLRIIFANHWLPRKVVTDNEASFTEEKFKSFVSDNGISHITTSPYIQEWSEEYPRSLNTGAHFQVSVHISNHSSNINRCGPSATSHGTQTAITPRPTVS